jgi:hypothetical protein
VLGRYTPIFGALIGAAIIINCATFSEKRHHNTLIPALIKAANRDLSPGRSLPVSYSKSNAMNEGSPRRNSSS